VVVTNRGDVFEGGNESTANRAGGHLGYVGIAPTTILFEASRKLVVGPVVDFDRPLRHVVEGEPHLVDPEYVSKALGNVERAIHLGVRPGEVGTIPGAWCVRGNEDAGRK
jgi:hypothetical protein